MGCQNRAALLTECLSQFNLMEEAKGDLATSGRDPAAPRWPGVVSGEALGRF